MLESEETSIIVQTKDKKTQSLQGEDASKFIIISSQFEHFKLDSHQFKPQLSSMITNSSRKHFRLMAKCNSNPLDDKSKMSLVPVSNSDILYNNSFKDQELSPSSLEYMF